MSRRPHILATNKELSLPAHALFLDAEAEECPLPDGRIELKRTVAWAAYWRKPEKGHTRNVKWVNIEDLDTFWNWVEGLVRSKTTLYIFAHNCYVDFSWLGGFSQLVSRGWKPEPPYVYGMTFIARWSKGTRRISLLDTTNYFHTTVEKLGETFGLEKLGEGGKPQEGVSWDDYCKRDIEIIMAAMLGYWEFIREHDLGGFAPTAGSQSMKAFRHRFMAVPVWIHVDERLTELERLSYHGGRCECFYQGALKEGPYYKLDFNSAYASVMHDYSYPCGDFSYRERPVMGDIEYYLARKLVIAKVLIQTDEPVYPYRLRGKLIFPVGSFVTVLTSRELEYALKHGHVREVYQLAIYPKARLFRTFIKTFYGLRLKFAEAGNHAYAMLAKLYCNSLYGKWGQKKIQRVELGECPVDEAYSEAYIDLDTGQQGYRYHYGGVVYAETKEGEAYNSFTAISAHIAADVRMKLWDTMQLAGKGHYYYCDTDSLWVDKVGLERLRAVMDEKRLGYYKVENIASDISIYAPKDYLFGGDVKHKGVPKGSPEIRPGVFQTTQWQGFRGAMQRNELGRVILTPTIKRLARHVEKGVLLEDGSIEPFLLIDGEKSSEVGALDRQAELELNLESFEGIKTIPQKVVFTVWDYKEGRLRHGVDNLSTASHYRGVPLDIVAAELGYPDYNSFLVAVEAQVETDRRVKALREKRGR